MLEKDEKRIQETYLSPADIKEILGFSKTKTYAIINQRDFPKIRFGREILIPKSEFEKFMKRMLYKEYKL